MVKLGEINPTVWDKVVEYMEYRLKEIEFNGDDIIVDWMKDANNNKLNREIFAKYGYFKDIILHPTFQYCKQWIHDNITWEFFLDDGKSLIPFSTIIIVLFMLYKKTSMDILFLTGAFLFNLNPLYVVSSVLLYWLIFQSSRKPKKYKHIQRIYKTEAIETIKPRDFSDIGQELLDSKDKKLIEYDHVLIGDDLSTLFLAAILSRVGHRCVVLQPLGACKSHVSHICHHLISLLKVLMY